MYKIKDIVAALESKAPLYFQEDFDNSGLQVGILEAPVTKVLVCLDVTEAVVEEAAKLGCELIVSHHPLIFRALKQIGDATYQQRCAVEAIKKGIAIYSAHTNLDNAKGGVNHKIASILGLEDLEWMLPAQDGKTSHGSGLVGVLKEGMKDEDFFSLLKDKFKVQCLLHSKADGRMIKKVALCGGAGAFLLPQAIAARADCFISGEFHYHDYFENHGVLLAELGHFQSEQFTIDLIAELLSEAFGELKIIKTSVHTNPIIYD